MSSSLGRVLARLAEPTETLPPELIALINQNVKPPTPVTADDVYVRAMYVVSDQVNSFGGRFPVDEHARLVELLIDSPVLIGHRRDKLPVGRNFHAETVERHGQPWVKCYFYWLRSSDDAEQLRDNIDGGIYKECSIAFTFNLPQCSLCGRDIRRCEHEPFEKYEVDGVEQVCYFDYRQIEKVLETSLVYRGAVPETSVSKDLASSGRDNITRPRLIPLDSLRSLSREKQYLVVPRYDGLPLTASAREGALTLVRLDGRPVGSFSDEVCRPTTFRPTEPVYGMLVGYRGRERCSLTQLERYLEDRTGPVSRLALNVYPHQGLLTLPRADSAAQLQIRLVPHRIVSYELLERRAREIMTRDGVEIWSLPPTGVYTDTDAATTYGYLPSGRVKPLQSGYRLDTQPRSAAARLSLSGVGTDFGHDPEQVFELAGFDQSLLGQGRHFVMRPSRGVGGSVKGDWKTVIEGRGQATTLANGALVVRCVGDSEQQMVLRPIRLNGEDLFLFSVSSGNAGTHQMATEAARE